MKHITAARVRPGDTITTPQGDTLTVTAGGWTDVDVYGAWVEPRNEPTHVYLDGTEDEPSVLLPVEETVTLVSRPAAPAPEPRPGEEVRTVTVGWTKHEDRDVSPTHIPFFHVWRPGQDQHEETITVAVPADLYGQRLAEVVFAATNHPDPDRLLGPAATIRKAILDTGYEGREAHWSLSVGDTVTVDGVRWAVDRFGWVLVEEVAR